jgi:hypothetical protein
MATVMKISPQGQIRIPKKFMAIPTTLPSGSKDLSGLQIDGKVQ